MPPIHVIAMAAAERLWYAQWDFWVALCTGLLAVATGYLAWETRGLRSDSAGAIVAAERNATAAENAVSVSTLSMQRSLRAYIVVDNIIGINRDNHSIFLDSKLTIKNAGQIPATNVSILHLYAFSADFPSPLSSPPAGRPLGIMAKDDKRELTLGWSTDVVSNQPQIMSSALSIYVYGVIRYNDGVSDVMRETEYAYTWAYQSGGFRPINERTRIT
jgi:hypothetical protein